MLKKGATTAALYVGDDKPLFVVHEGAAYDTRDKTVAAVIKQYPDHFTDPDPAE